MPENASFCRSEFWTINYLKLIFFTGWSKWNWNYFTLQKAGSENPRFDEPQISAQTWISRLEKYHSGFYRGIPGKLIPGNVLLWPQFFFLTVCTLKLRVLTQWRHMPMGQFMPIFFWYKLLPLTSGPQKFSKIGAVKVDFFDFPSKKFEKFVCISY